jgi:hypothetical protein
MCQGREAPSPRTEGKSVEIFQAGPKSHKQNANTGSQIAISFGSFLGVDALTV